MRPRAHAAARAGVGAALVASAALPLNGCAVVSVAGSAVGAAVSVAGAVVGTAVKVTGKVIEKTIDAVTPDSTPGVP